MKMHLTLVAAWAVLLAAPAALAGNAPEKAAVCAACHGAEGQAMMPGHPHLAGQYSNYLEHALKEYRSGVRKNAIMGAQAAALSDEDIKQLAAYYASLPGPLHTPNVHGHAQAAAH